MLIDINDLMNEDDDNEPILWTKELLEGRLIIAMMIEADPYRPTKYKPGWCSVRVIDGETGEVLTHGFPAMGNLAKSLMRIRVGDAAGGRIASGKNMYGHKEWGFNPATSDEDKAKIKRAWQLYAEASGQPPF